MKFYDSKRNASLVLLAISLCSMVYAFYLVLFRHEVDCGSQVMQPWQTCQDYSHLDSDPGRNYAQQHRRNLIDGGVIFVLSGLAGGYAVRNLVIIHRTKPTTYPQANSPF